MAGTVKGKTMPKTEEPDATVDWSLATWEGSRREALRRWARRPLERVIAALEEMQELSDLLSTSRAAGASAVVPPAESAVHEPHGDYKPATETPPASAPAAGDGRRPSDPNSDREK